jgi:hypothetical protein
VLILAFSFAACGQVEESSRLEIRTRIIVWQSQFSGDVLARVGAREQEERRLAGEAIFAVILLAHVHLNVHARLG